MRENRVIVNTVFCLCEKTWVLLHSVLSMREDKGIVNTASCLYEKRGVLLTQCFVYARRQGYC